MVLRIDKNILNSCKTCARKGGPYCVMCNPTDDAGDYWLNHSSRREFQKGLQLLLNELSACEALQFQEEIEILFGGNTRFKGKSITWNMGQEIATWPPMLFDFPIDEES